MSIPITAAMLYDYLACPHRVTMDLYGDPVLQDPLNAFVELLWRKGTLYEREVIAALNEPFLDLSRYTPEEKEQQTLAAMERGEPLIHGGRISADNLLGYPSLLRKESRGYVAISIKSGAGEEGSGDSASLKTHYGVQLALYTDILQRLGYSAGKHAFIWDVHGEEVAYDLTAMQKKESLWEAYLEAVAEVEKVIDRTVRTRPAYAACCKNCNWYSACCQTIREIDDLTMVAELGRSKRDVMTSMVPTLHALAEAHPEDFFDGKQSRIKGIGKTLVRQFLARARLLVRPDAKPYASDFISFPAWDCELFFDVEVDPLRDICYLHGFVERHYRDNSTERFVYFFAEEPTQEAEERAFAAAIDYLRERRPCAIYYFSKYERTIYLKLQRKYPWVCSAEEIEDLFDPEWAIDLYFDVVRKFTEWPLWDRSLKSLAKYLGFRWRDTHPSGAASIEWFDKWVNSRDLTVRERILDYNEDDCRATRVLRDGIVSLEVIVP